MEFMKVQLESNSFWRTLGWRESWECEDLENERTL